MWKAKKDLAWQNGWMLLEDGPVPEQWRDVETTWVAKVAWYDRWRNGESVAYTSETTFHTSESQTHCVLNTRLGLWWTKRSDLGSRTAPALVVLMGGPRYYTLWRFWAWCMSEKYERLITFQCSCVLFVLPFERQRWDGKDYIRWVKFLSPPWTARTKCRNFLYSSMK